MARTWPSLATRARVPAGLLSEIALAGMLGAVLAFSWSDGTPYKDVVAPVVPKVDFTASAGGYADPAHGRTPLAPPAPPPKPPPPSSPPAMILIASLDVHRPVEAVGVDSDGAMSVPQNLWNAGWYKLGAVPGDPGDSVIEGHAGWPNAPLLFGRISQLRSGDKIVIVLADGTQRLFVVDSVTSWPALSHPTGLFAPQGPPRLSLITCTGPFDDKSKTYPDRLVVEATYAGQA